MNTDRDGNHVSDKAVGFRHATGEREFAPFSQLSSCVIQGHLRVFDLSFDLGTIKYDPPSYFIDKIRSALLLHRGIEWVEYLSDGFQSVWHFVMDIFVSQT